MRRCVSRINDPMGQQGEARRGPLGCQRPTGPPGEPPPRRLILRPSGAALRGGYLEQIFSVLGSGILHVVSKRLI